MRREIAHRDLSLNDFGEQKWFVKLYGTLGTLINYHIPLVSEALRATRRLEEPQRKLLQTQHPIGGVAADDIEIVAAQRATRDAHCGISRTLQHGSITLELAPYLPIVERNGETAAGIVAD